MNLALLTTDQLLSWFSALPRIIDKLSSESDWAAEGKAVWEAVKTAAALINCHPEKVTQFSNVFW